MNAPPAFKLFLLFKGVKITINKDTKVPNACLLTINKEDDTLRNIIKSQLLKDAQVPFASYKVPHPLEHKIIIRVQTTSGWPSKTSKKELNSELEGALLSLEAQLQPTLGTSLRASGTVLVKIAHEPLSPAPMSLVLMFPS
ncbi:PREDICTED: DNA-directed RNA polymerase II subunit RPB11-b1-like [Chrysochloris asiatica]|uniref:DNA-directed RNA polymerase II subunit RPB11-b1-like n=1 Tax=Chrysochloris asiatica TaxID=185453 RepID=A0A9B0WG12_CHRAS|nr:PREDICTED: DNA-directed RNA polymerase II subunit RPB11-b1-like [Chrysochloris asiatica]